MDETAWLGEQTDLREMLAFVENRISERKQRLFACAVCRRLLNANLSRMVDAVKLVEAYADDLADIDELRREHKLLGKGPPWRGMAYALTDPKLDLVGLCAAATSIAGNASIGSIRKPILSNIRKQLALPGRIEEQVAQVELLREVVGNPFRPVIVEPTWLTWMFGTVPKLAEAIYNDRKYANLPILADALEEAGCDNAEILSHCRSGGVHVRGCWAIDLLLGKE